MALQNLPIVFAIDRAGLVGPDGPTHAGSFDLSFLRCIPNMLIMAPADENECRQMLYTGFQHQGPSAIRYPRGRGPGITVQKEMHSLSIGKSELCRQGSRVAILAFGSMVAMSLEAGEELNASVVNMRFVKPLDAEMVIKMASSHELLITIEENSVLGGAGSAVNECLASHDIEIPIINLGLPDDFIEHGQREELLTDCGLSSQGIITVADDFFLKHACQNRPVKVNS